MSQNRGFQNKQSQGRELAGTVTESGDKIGLDVNVVSSGSDFSSGSLLDGISFKSITLTKDTLTDTYNYYADSLKTELLTTVVVTFTNAEKCDIQEVSRTDA